MMTSFKTLAIAASVSAIACAAAAQDAKMGGTLNTIVQPEPTGLNLGLLQNAPTQMVAGQIYESLLRYDENLDPMPGLAREWTVSDDGLTYTFTLQDGVTWHDGQPFSAADVVFSHDVFLRETSSRWRTVLQHVDSITAPDDTTVVYKLKTPFGPFLRSFESGSSPILPRHIYEGTDFAGNPANATPIGTGPFKFDTWEQGSYIHLVKNDDYYRDGLPKLDDIYYRVIPDAASRTIAFETGEVDVLPAGSVEMFDLPRIQAMDNVCVTDKGWEFFGPLSLIWLNNRNAPLDDANLRRAINMAIDRDFAVNAIFAGFGRPATGAVNSSTRFYSGDTPSIQFDPDAARELVEASSYDGQTLRLLPLPYGEVWQRWAEAVRQNLSDIGVNVELVASDVAGWNQRLADWDYDMAFTFVYQYGDPALGVARNYISSNIAKGSQWNNVEGFENPEIDRLFAEGATALTDEERTAIYAETQALLVEESPVAWLTEMQQPTVYRCEVKDLVTSAIGLNDSMRDTWLDR